MKKHKIGWLNVPGYIPQTWNPIVGCSKVSEGCRNCYAERMALRLVSMGCSSYSNVLKWDSDGTVEKWSGETFLVEDAMKKPLGWKKPRAIFVNSMGDLFHENTPDEWIDRVFAVMALCPQHLFIVLTKRAERMEKYITGLTTVDGAIRFEGLNGGKWDGRLHKTALKYRTGTPLQNVWLGVTTENQAAADERIPHLQNTPAAVRFVSCEPLIGPVDLMYSAFNGTDSFLTMCGIDWIICGGESGPGARPMNPDWARSIRDQAQAASVPFFFKQWGRFHGGYRELPNTHSDLLDGQQYHQWPKTK
jgi:protein gp37